MQNGDGVLCKIQLECNQTPWMDNVINKLQTVQLVEPIVDSIDSGTWYPLYKVVATVTQRCVLHKCSAEWLYGDRIIQPTRKIFKVIICCPVPCSLNCVAERFNRQFIANIILCISLMTMIFLRRRVKLWTPDSLVWIVCLLKGTLHRCVVYHDITQQKSAYITYLLQRFSSYDLYDFLFMN